jgi:Flp pilus assembly CpaF family ATPase
MGGGDGRIAPRHGQGQAFGVVAAGVMTTDQAAVLREAVAARKNILVAGGTSTGKTTLTNALLAEIAGTTDRVVLIEDTRELQCRAPNLVALRTKDGVASLSDLVHASLRLRPDRIPIGEVRGAEALDLLKAWGTGHPGGIGTIHAGTALGTLRRLEAPHQDPASVVRQAQEHRRDHQRGDDQRGLDPRGLRRRQQGGRCGPGATGAGVRQCRPGLCHRHHHGLG